MIIYNIFLIVILCFSKLSVLRIRLNDLSCWLQFFDYQIQIYTIKFALVAYEIVNFLK